MSERLQFDPQERTEILSPYSAVRPELAKPAARYVRLNQDQYEVVSDWRAFAVLNLVKTQHFKNETGWIAERLDISRAEVRETIGRLKRLEMLAVDEGGQLVRTVSQYNTSEDILNLSQQKSHRQTLDLAAHALENKPVEIRDLTWLTLPVDTRKMDEAKLKTPNKRSQKGKTNEI